MLFFHSACYDGRWCRHGCFMITVVEGVVDVHVSFWFLFSRVVSSSDH